MAWLELDIKKLTAGHHHRPLQGCQKLTCTATQNVAKNNGAMPAAYTILKVPIPPEGRFRLVPHASGWS